MKFSDIVILNEEAINMNRELTPEQIKRAKSTYQVFKTGVFTIAGARIKYVLPDDFYVDLGQYDKKLLIIPETAKNEKRKEFALDIYLFEEDGSELFIPQPNSNVYNLIIKRIVEKFNKFKITIIF